jgi:hypothetical protein
MKGREEEKIKIERKIRKGKHPFHPFALSSFPSYVLSPFPPF